MDAAPEYQSVLNYTRFPNDSRNSGPISSGNIHYWTKYLYHFYYHYYSILISMIIIICILGVAGNGIVIWLFGFRVQRNPFMTYILNLAIADLGVLLSGVLYVDPFFILPDSAYKMKVTGFLPLLMYSTSQFLLTAISIDRCVAVFFPLWHRCHRPPRFPAIVCALMWLISFLLTTVTISLLPFDPTRWNIQHVYQFIVNAVLSLPLMTISTLVLFIKVCFQQRQRRRGKLLTILLLTLAFFLLCAFPFNVIYILRYNDRLPDYVPYVGILLAFLNSSINPVIYFLVGRQRKTRRRETLKMMIQRVFKEEDSCSEGSPAETQL